MNGGYGGGTHPGMSWWVWWRYSPRNGLVGMVEVLTQEWVGGYGGDTHPGMSWWVWWRYSPRNGLVGMVEVLTQEWVGGYDGDTHPGMSWWVWWRYSPRNGLVGMVEVLTQEWVGGYGGGTHPGMSWWVWWRYSPRIELVGTVVAFVQSSPSSARIGPSSHNRSNPPTRFSFPVSLQLQLYCIQKCVELWLIQTELKWDRDQEYCLTVYYVEPSHCNLCGNLKRTGNSANGLPGNSAPYLVNLWGT